MNEDKILNLQLNLNQINIVLAGLGKVPLETSLQTFESIHKQVGEQMQPEPPQLPVTDKLVK